MTSKNAILRTGRGGILTALALATVLVTGNNPSYAGWFGQHHPRRAEVLHRDSYLNREIRCDRGNLGGRYWQLESEDGRIRRQEQRDARLNGGYITPAEQYRLNWEESRLQRQINRDYHP